jgi:hypothetical protein
MKIRPLGAELFHADGRKDMTKLIVSLRSFAKAPNELPRRWKHHVYSRRREQLTNRHAVTSQQHWLLGALTTLTKRLLPSSCLSVRPSTWNNSAPTGQIFTKFEICIYFFFFGNSVEKIPVPLEPDTNNRYFTRRPLYVYDSISLDSS